MRTVAYGMVQILESLLPIEKMKSYLFTIFFSSINLMAQDIEFSLKGKWAESEILLTDSLFGFDSTDLVYNDWTFDFLDNGKFIENSHIICGNDTLMIKGRWINDGALHIHRTARCIRWSKKYSYGRDIIGEVKWISANLWYICVSSDYSENAVFGVIAYRRIQSHSSSPAEE
jgi:hypothetical protein